ncbi:MAG: hypothetical protein E7411_05855 [Ruminococcaceae bacterium]|nr:hypothetical protein [Oscillospiraceae bacterium]
MNKKILFVILCVLLSAVTTQAGSIDTDISFYDDALLFIGSVDDYVITDNSPDYPDTEYSLTLTPVKKIKGDVVPGEKLSFENVHSGKLKLKKNSNYLFGCLKNQLYIWELEYYENLFDWERDDYHKDSIILKDRHNDSISGGMQKMLREGVFEKAEAERLDIGNKKPLLEYAKNISRADKIRFTINGESTYVDKESFLEIAKNINITNIKNRTVENSLSGELYENILYIDALNEADSSFEGVFIAVTPKGEVDRYNMIMSSLMTADYEMDKSDLQKLYSLLPDNIVYKLKKTGVIGLDKASFNPLWVVLPLALIGIILITVKLFRRK